MGYTGMEVGNIGGLVPVLDHCRKLLHGLPNDQTWLPYWAKPSMPAWPPCGRGRHHGHPLRFWPGAPADAGLGADRLQRPRPGYLNGPIDDIQLRSWGIQLVDGRMPGFAAIIGAARSNQAAVEIVRQLQMRNILIFLSGNVNGRSMIHQLMEEGVEMGYDTYIVPFGLDTVSTVYPWALPPVRR